MHRYKSPYRREYVQPKDEKTARSLEIKPEPELIEHFGKTDYFLLKGGRVELDQFRQKKVTDAPKKTVKKQTKSKLEEDEQGLIAQYLKHKYLTLKDFVAKRSLLRQHKNRSIRLKELHSSSSVHKSFNGDTEPQELLIQNKEKQKRLLEAIRQKRSQMNEGDFSKRPQFMTYDETRLKRIDTFGPTKSVDESPVKH